MRHRSRITSLDDDWFEWSRKDAPLITVSTLMSGEIAKMDPPAEANVSYTVEFWGTTLRCQTENHTLTRVVRESDVALDAFLSYEGMWEVQDFTQSTGIHLNMDEDLLLNQTTLTHRVVPETSRNRYYPCLETINGTLEGNRSSGSVGLPEAGITILFPVTETVCHPTISRYSVTIAHRSGTQNITHSIRTDEPIPSYHKYLEKFNGSFEQWVQFSDALTVYAEFAYNLNRSTFVLRNSFLSYEVSSERAERFTLDNGTSVETCEIGSLHLDENIPSRLNLDIWPLSVFARRIRLEERDEWQTPFDADMANELLINSTINMLSLNKHFDMVAGTTSRTFNVYRFRNKLAFFLPYGLALGLSIPMIALGLAAFYTRNQRVSAITGGFLQIFMTTTGRGSLEDVIVKGSGTMGGYENVSEELRETQIMFGELSQSNSTDDGHFEGQDLGLSAHEERRGSSEISSYVNNRADFGASLASGIEVSEKEGTVPMRAGFGIADEVRPLRKRMTHA